MPKTHARPSPPRCATHRQGILFVAFCILAVLSTACGPDPLAEAKQHQARGAFAASLEPLRTYLDQHPEDSEAQFLYGMALSSTSRLTEAIWPLRRAAEDPEWKTPATLQLARMAVGTADWDMATGLLDPLIDEQPDDVQALGIRAFARAQSRRDYEGALADADRILEIDPENSDGLILRGVALLGLDRIEEAREAIASTSEHFDEAGLGLAGSPDFCAVRAGFAEEQGEADKAREVFEECLERFPTNFTILDGAVRFFDAAGEPERSLEILRGAYEAMPNVRTYRMSLVYRLGLAGEDNQAEEILVQATNAASPALAAIAHSDLAGYYFERDRLDEAITHFESTLALISEPGPTFLFAYADTLVTAERYDDALALTERMNLPSHRELIRGRVALERGEPAEALAHFEEGFKLWPANAVARYYAGLAAEQLGDFDRAIEEYRYSIRAEPSATDARLRLARLYLATGQPSVALEVVRHQAAEAGSDSLDRTLLEIELLAMLGQPVMIGEASRSLIQQPEHLPQAVAARARGARTRAGAEAGLREVTGAQNLDLTAPNNAPALESVIRDLVALGRASDALAQVDRAAKVAGSAAHLHALRGYVIAETAVEPEQARPEFERAIALDPESFVALIGLARLEGQAGKIDEALALYGRAAAADSTDQTALHEAIELAQAGDRGEAELRLLEASLERDPYAAAEAGALAQKLIEADPDARDSMRVQTLLRTASYFDAERQAKARP